MKKESIGPYSGLKRGAKFTTGHSYHEGANDERTAILAKVRRMQRNQFPGMSGLPLNELENWLLSRVKRNKAKAGGL